MDPVQELSNSDNSFCGMVSWACVDVLCLCLSQQLASMYMASSKRPQKMRTYYSYLWISLNQSQSTLDSKLNPSPHGDPQHSTRASQNRQGSGWSEGTCRFKALFLADPWQYYSCRIWDPVQLFGQAVECMRPTNVISGIKFSAIFMLANLSL